MNQNTEYKEIVIHEGKWLHYKELHFTLKGQQITWQYLQRPPNHRGGIALIPIVKYKNKSDQIILIANYRVPINQYCLEFPAGLIDKDGSLTDNAIRELKEETGYTPRTHQEPIQAINDPWKAVDQGYTMIVEIDGDDPQNQDPKQQLEHDENIIVYKFDLNQDLLENMQKCAKDNNYSIVAAVLTFAIGYSYNI